MNLSTLRAAVVAYHRKTSPSDLVIGGTDMFLMAANNARRSAELQHNFELARVSGTITIDGVNGADISTIQYEGDVGVNITGTLSPDATGSYRYQGSFNGAPFYLKLTSDPTTSFALWYDSGVGKWYLNRFTYFAVVPGDGSSYASDLGVWSLTRDGSSPAGTYTSETVGYTGSPVVSVGATSFSSFKEFTSIARIRPDGIRVPMDFSNPDVPIERDRTRWELNRFWSSDLRWPSDADILQHNWAITIYQRGTMLFRYPRDTISKLPLECHIEGYGWLQPYTTSQLTNSPDPTAPAEDFILGYGEEYMLWKVICDLNPLFGTFVPREEGNVASPEKQLDAAWQRLLLWDSYVVDSHTTRSR